MSETATMLTEAGLKNLHRRCTQNRSLLAGRCGCFYCLSTFVAENVTQWIDDGQTALCPVCGIDAVLPDVGIDLPMLEQMHERWFGRTVRIENQADWDRAIAGNPPLA